MTRDGFRHAAHERAVDTATSVTANHDDIRRPLDGGLHDLCGGLSDGDELECRWIARGTLPEGGKAPSAILFGQRNQIRWRHSALRHNGLAGVDDKDEGQLGSESLREFHAHIHRMRGDGALVNSKEDSSEAHANICLKAWRAGNIALELGRYAYCLMIPC